MKEQIMKIIKAEMERHNEATLREAYAAYFGLTEDENDYHNIAAEIYRFVTELESAIGEIHLYVAETSEYHGYTLTHYVLKEW